MANQAAKKAEKRGNEVDKVLKPAVFALNVCGRGGREGGYIPVGKRKGGKTARRAEAEVLPPFSSSPPISSMN
jgi:hypothetical protein